MGQSLRYIMNDNCLEELHLLAYTLYIIHYILCKYIIHYVDTHIRMNPLLFMCYVCRDGLMYLGPKTKIEAFYMEYLNTIFLKININ